MRLPEFFPASFRKLALALAQGRLTGSKAQQPGRAALSALQRGSDPDQSRRYVQGDDARDLDWSAIARHQDLYVKTREPDALGCSVVMVDQSASMFVDDGAKVVAAWRFALLWAALQCRTRRVVIGSTTTTMEVSGPGDLSKSMDRLELLTQTPTNQEMRVPKAGKVDGLLIVSDFLFEPLELERLLRIRPQPRRVIALSVMAKSERVPELVGAVRLQDGENNEALTLHLGDTNRLRYAEALNRHEDVLRLVLRPLRGEYVVTLAESDDDAKVRFILGLGQAT